MSDRVPDPRRSLVSGIVVLSLIAVACDRSDESPSDVDAAPAWSAAVDFEISGLDEDGRGFLAPEQMHVAGASAFLLHQRERRIRTFDRRTGGGLRTLVGPDDIRDPRGFGVLGDTLWVRDALPQSKFRLFSITSGEPLGIVPVADRYGNVRGTHLISSDEVLARTSVPSQAVVQGEVRQRTLLRAGIVGEVLDTIASVSVERSVLGFVRDDGGGIYSDQPFSDDPLFALSPDVRWLAVLEQRVRERSEATARLELRNLGGYPALASTIRYRPREIDPRWIDGIVRNWQGHLGMPYSHSGPMIRNRLYQPEHLPFAVQLVVDADARAWIRLWDAAEMIDRYDLRSAPPTEATWLVVERTAGPPGWVHLPPDVRWLYSAGDTLWGTRVGDDGSGVIIRYRLATESDDAPARGNDG